MPSHTTSHTATVSVVRRGRAWKSVMLMHRVHQDVRSPRLVILPQRTIGRTALLTLKAKRFKVPLLGRPLELFAFAWSVNRLLSAQRARSRIIAFTLRLRSAAARPLTRTIRFW